MLLFDFGRETNVLSKSHFSQNFPISLGYSPSRGLSRARTCMALTPPLCHPGVNVTMPTQPGMPPLSSTQLQIDTALQEFQLVDLSRRFLVHDSFWALPEQFLGNKVTDRATALDGEVAEPRCTCPEPAWAPLPLKPWSSRAVSALGDVSSCPSAAPRGQQLIHSRQGQACHGQVGRNADSAVGKASQTTPHV